MIFTDSKLSSLSPSPVVENLERLRVVSKIGHQEWFDLLGMTWLEYRELKNGLRRPENGLFDGVASHFGISAESLENGTVDFRALEWRLGAGAVLPEHYRKAAYGRLRSSLTSMDVLEKRFGWRIRHEALSHLGVEEAALRDPFAPVSVGFITDLCEYLGRRQYRAEDLFALGAGLYEGNKNTLVGRAFSQMGDVQELYAVFLGEAMRVFEQNWDYRIMRMNKQGLVFDAVANEDVCAESGRRHLGSARLCELRTGITACLPQFIGLPMARVTKTRCVHRGDSVCRFEVEFPTAAVKRPS